MFLELLAVFESGNSIKYQLSADQLIIIIIIIVTFVKRAITDRGAKTLTLIKLNSIRVYIAT